MTIEATRGDGHIELSASSGSTVSPPHPHWTKRRKADQERPAGGDRRVDQIGGRRRRDRRWQPFRDLVTARISSRPGSRHDRGLGTDRPRVQSLELSASPRVRKFPAIRRRVLQRPDGSTHHLRDEIGNPPTMDSRRWWDQPSSRPMISANVASFSSDGRRYSHARPTSTPSFRRSCTNISAYFQQTPKLSRMGTSRSRRCRCW